MLRGPFGNRDPPLVTLQSYLGACLLTAALLAPHAPGVPLVAGLVLGGVILAIVAALRRGARDD
jgi:hypothetical protein